MASNVAAGTRTSRALKDRPAAAKIFGSMASVGLGALFTATYKTGR